MPVFTTCSKASPSLNFQFIETKIWKHTGYFKSIWPEGCANTETVLHCGWALCFVHAHMEPIFFPPLLRWSIFLWKGGGFQWKCCCVLHQVAASSVTILSAFTRCTWMHNFYSSTMTPCQHPLNTVMSALTSENGGCSLSVKWVTLFCGNHIQLKATQNKQTLTPNFDAISGH